MVLDEKLVREAMKLAKVGTKREAVDIALRRFVQSGKQKKLLELHGTGGKMPVEGLSAIRTSAVGYLQRWTS